MLKIEEGEEWFGQRQRFLAVAAELAAATSALAFPLPRGKGLDSNACVGDPRRGRSQWLLATLASGPFVSAQAPEPQAPLLPPVSAEVVRIEVVVTDKRGRPKAGLGRGDFVILEDGKPQAIVQFQSFTRPQAGRPSVSLPGCPRGRAGAAGAAARPLRGARDRRRPPGVQQPGPAAEGPRPLHRRRPGARGPGRAGDHERVRRDLAGIHLRPRGPAPDPFPALLPGSPLRMERRALHDRVPGRAHRGRRQPGPRRGRAGDHGLRSVHGRGVGRTAGEAEGPLAHGGSRLQLPPDPGDAREPGPRPGRPLGPQGDVPRLRRVPDRALRRQRRRLRHPPHRRRLHPGRGGHLCPGDARSRRGAARGERLQHDADPAGDDRPDRIDAAAEPGGDA